MCSIKYGDDWKEYKKRVPAIFVPGLACCTSIDDDDAPPTPPPAGAPPAGGARASWLKCACTEAGGRARSSSATSKGVHSSLTP